MPGGLQVRARSIAHDAQHEQFVRAILERRVPRDVSATVATGVDATIAVRELDLSDQFISTLADRELVAAFNARHRDILPPATAPASTSEALLGGRVVESPLAPLAPLDPPQESAFDLAVAQRDAERLSGGEVRLLDAREPAVHRRDVSRDVDGTPVAASWFDSGAQPRTSLIRLQLNRGDRFGPVGSGDNVDLVLSVLRARPEVEAVVTLAARHVHAWLDTLREARVSRAAPMILLVVDEPPTPWAQDNGAPVSFANGERGLLRPRGATRSDLPLEHVATDDAAAAALAERLRVHRADWFFQGGDLFAINLASQKILLVGEAQLARNLHLNAGGRAEVERLRAGTGADRVIVLPSVSPHIDYEVCPVVTGAGVRFVVGDQRAAAALMVHAALERLSTPNHLGDRVCAAALARDIRAAVEAHDDAAVAQRAHALLAPFMQADGMIAHAFADAFLPENRNTQALDAQSREALRNARTHVGAARRTLAALDVLSARAFASAPLAGTRGVRAIPSKSATPPAVAPFVAYLNAIARLQGEREQLHAVLRALCSELDSDAREESSHPASSDRARGSQPPRQVDAEVVAVPSMAFGDRSACAVNALVMPNVASVPGAAGSAGLSILVPCLEGDGPSVADREGGGKTDASAAPTLGIFTGFDRAVVESWQTKLEPLGTGQHAAMADEDASASPIHVTGVASDESQRRQGGVHCAAQWISE